MAQWRSTITNLHVIKSAEASPRGRKRPFKQAERRNEYHNDEIDTNEWGTYLLPAWKMPKRKQLPMLEGRVLQDITKVLWSAKQACNSTLLLTPKIGCQQWWALCDEQKENELMIFTCAIFSLIEVLSFSQRRRLIAKNILSLCVLYRGSYCVRCSCRTCQVLQLIQAVRKWPRPEKHAEEIHLEWRMIAVVTVFVAIHAVSNVQRSNNQIRKVAKLRTHRPTQLRSSKRDHRKVNIAVKEKKGNWIELSRSFHDLLISNKTACEQNYLRCLLAVAVRVMEQFIGTWNEKRQHIQRIQNNTSRWRGRCATATMAVSRLYVPLIFIPFVPIEARLCYRGCTRFHTTKAKTK